MLLAQINLNEVPDNQMLPKTGMLQFFIWYDRNYGLSMQESGYPIIPIRLCTMRK